MPECEKCHKVVDYLFREWKGGNPCDPDYVYVCKECKGHYRHDFTSDMIY